MIRRAEVIQSYLDLFNKPKYLEIGVSHGVTFHALTAALKIAVDPKFQIEDGQREESSEYHEITSDAYFYKTPLNVPLFDVIYLDGLHTFEQTLRDLMNAIDILNRNGIIIVDDVVPSSYEASLTDFREIAAIRKLTGSPERAWMGDTYRLVFFVQSFLPNFSYATTEDNHGQLVMWRAKRPVGPVVERRIEDIARAEFRNVATQRAAFNFLPNAEILRQVRTAHGHPAMKE